MPQALKPYLTYSLALHLALAASFIRIAGFHAESKTPVYSIDFIGPAAGVIDMAKFGPTAKSVAAAAPRAPQTFEEFRALLKGKHIELPKPSLVSGKAAPAPPAEEEAAPSDKPAEAPAAPSAPGEGGAAAGLVTDMPNFPYPWYLSQVRQALWSQWSAHMPKDAGAAVISFSLLPDGGMTDLRVEESSGDSAFDLTAMGAVRDAGPFPALPSGFTEPFLKFHVTLKSG